MNRIASFVTPFLLGVGLTIGLAVLPGAAEPQERENTLDTQVVPVAGGLAMLLAINDHDKNRLYFYNLPGKKDSKVELRGSVDLSAVGQEELPSELKSD